MRNKNTDKAINLEKNRKNKIKTLPTPPTPFPRLDASPRHIYPL